MSGESLSGDVYTEGRLKPVTLIFCGLVALACVYLCVCAFDEYVSMSMLSNRANAITLKDQTAVLCDPHFCIHNLHTVVCKSRISKS